MAAPGGYRQWPMPQDVDRDELQRLMEQGAQLVEVLPKEEYEEEHLPGAIHLPLRKIETDADSVLDRTRPIVVYCWDTA
jgi:rhodanese-related sulfurtransferase